MIERIIELSLKNRQIIFFGIALLSIAGLWALKNISLDAIPDLSDVQVIVYTKYDGQAPEVVEDQVTYPLSSSLLAVPYAKNVRGYSFFGFSLVYVIFEDGTDLYWARSRVLEYINSASERLPPDISPSLGPDASGVGWVYMYSLTAKPDSNLDLSDLRSLQDFYLKNELTSLQGVAEVASLGGFVKQYQIVVDPLKLRALNLSLSEVIAAIKQNNADVGGRSIEMAETEYIIRGQGYLNKLDDFRKIPVAFDKASHTPILLSQVADLQIGPELRRGLAEMNGEGEVVSGIVVMRSGANALKVIDSVKKRLEELKPGLPQGVEIITSYDRSNLIKRAINTLREKITAEFIAVLLVSIIFLLHIRSAFVAIITLPVAILISFLLMYFLDIGANIMSLGGIALAIGVMVDASVVLVENIHKHKERNPSLNQLEIVLLSAKEVAPALFYSLLIVTISFVPVFALEQQEGKLFTPLAYTKTFAMAISSVLAITLIPILSLWLVKGKIIPEQKNPINKILAFIYAPILAFSLKYPKIILAIFFLGLASCIYPFMKIGSEFMPPLNEGDILYMPTTVPGISITKAKELLQQSDKIIRSHPQVAHVLGKAGRADSATDPAPLNMLETTIILKPQSEWPPKKTIEDIMSELDKMVQFPGLTNSWTMPIKTRIDMLATGIKTPVGIKLYGSDLAELAKLAEQIEAVLRDLPQTGSVFAERVVGANYINIAVDRERAARFGLSVDQVNQVIKSAIGGMNISYSVEGLKRFPINVRFPRELRENVEELKRVSVTSPAQHAVPLANVADISISKGPPAIKSENGKKTAWIFVDPATSDMGGYVALAKKVLAEKIIYPAGVFVKWSGQFEYLNRAKQKFMVLIPLTLALIFLLLFMHFGSLSQSLIVILTLPFAITGGIWLVYLLDFNLSVAVIVGFIALAGLAAETSVVMMVYLDNAIKEIGSHFKMGDLLAAIKHGALDRLRPKIMVVSMTMAGLLPIMFGSETGTRVMKRIAAPMVGGLVSSTFLTLVIIPAIYLLWKRALAKNENSTEKS